MRIKHLVCGDKTQKTANHFGSLCIITWPQYSYKTVQSTTDYSIGTLDLREHVTTQM